jgi:HAD superfamily hydrolase (TIGR01450 family)
MTRVAFIGLGAMGGRLARRLLDAGHDVTVWNRTRARAKELLDAGATLAATPADAAGQSEVVITMVTDLPALLAVISGRGGLAGGIGGSTTLIEMSTVGPAAVTQLAPLMPDGVGLLDAPVLGSISEAEAGTLRVFVGGPTPLVQLWMPLLSTFGIAMHVGPLGAGAAAKLVANSTLFGVLGTLGEALALADGLGLARDVAFEVLAATPLASQAERRRPAIETDDYPPRYTLALALKDAGLIIKAAETARVDVRLLKAAESWLADSSDAGWAGRDYSAVLATILHGHDGDRSRSGDAASTVPVLEGGRLDCDGLIVDLDGVVWRGQEAIDGAADAIAAIRAKGIRVVFLTNEPANSRSAFAARLTDMGIPSTEADVLTSAAATARVVGALKGLASRRALVIGPPALHDEIENVGFELVAENDAIQAQVVVVGGHEGFDYRELSAATAAIRNGARLFATGRDAIFPTPAGPKPGTGSIVAAVEIAGGASAVVVGKPEPIMFEIAREALAGCERIAVVGDHLIADIEGAKRVGMAAALVLTGTTSRADLEQAVIPPDLVLESLATLPEVVRVSRSRLP